MKIRDGFVSNSSSTSFLIVGVDNYRDPRLAQLALADKWEEGGQGYHTGKTLVFLGGEYTYDENDKPTDYQPTYVGIEVEKMLKMGLTVDALKLMFINKAKALGITFNDSEVDLHYGEVSSE